MTVAIALLLVLVLLVSGMVYFTPTPKESPPKEKPTPKFHELLKKIPSDWSRDDFVLCGSAALAVRGIRDVRDLDILVRPELMRRLSLKKDPDGYTESLDPEIDVFDKPLRLETFLNFDDIKKTADFIDGYYIQSVRHTMAIKALLPTPRDKDRPDILALAQIIASEGSKPATEAAGPYR